MLWPVFDLDLLSGIDVEVHEWGSESSHESHVLAELRLKSWKFPVSSDTFHRTVVSIWLMRTLKWR